MGQVRRVETAAQKTNARGRGSAQVCGHAQSRGRRKSVYSRASGVPGSGCQS
jgi:hypothetical protein